jgi:hypothetical protein
LIVKERHYRRVFNMASDPFDDVLNLENHFYDEGYSQGMQDGLQAGKIEGRTMGLEKGYAKFLESGRLFGKAVVWANRLPKSTPTTEVQRQMDHQGSNGSLKESPACKLPPLNSNQRLEKNISTVYALLEPDTLSTENDDDAVNDFEDRIKRAQGRVKIIERAVGEGIIKESSIAPTTATAL